MNWEKKHREDLLEKVDHLDSAIFTWDIFTDRKKRNHMIDLCHRWLRWLHDWTKTPQNEEEEKEAEEEMLKRAGII